MDEKDAAPAGAARTVRLPSTEELRMVRAIALLALQEAARHGEYRATFRGFRVQALRQYPAPGSGPFVEVKLWVSLDRSIMERGFLSASDGCAIEPTP